jgi:hypothetical protein
MYNKSTIFSIFLIEFSKGEIRGGGVRRLLFYNNIIYSRCRKTNFAFWAFLDKGRKFDQIKKNKSKKNKTYPVITKGELFGNQCFLGKKQILLFNK